MTNLDEMSTTESSSTRSIPLDSLQKACNAIIPKLRTASVRQDLRPGDAVEVGEPGLVEEVSLVATGGYNSVFLVKLHSGLLVEKATPTAHHGESIPSHPHKSALMDRFILRLPSHDALVPYQITNEVAFRRFIASNLPHIPVPPVYFFQATQDYATCFIAEEFIEGSSSSSSWMTFTPTQKESIARKLSSITADLAETRFDMIGGLNVDDFSPAPTVEGCKLFKGRHRFHRHDCYHIGLYHSTKEYILACYDGEICYDSHASEEDIDADLFEDVSVPEYVQQLQQKREVLARQDMADEPFALTHDDFHGRNVLMHGDQIAAILDWEFAGSYPLGETLSGGGIDVVDADSEELDEENALWGRRIRDLIRQEAQLRGWSQDHVDLLMGDGNHELATARTEMFPS